MDTSTIIAFVLILQMLLFIIGLPVFLAYLIYNWISSRNKASNAQSPIKQTDILMQLKSETRQEAFEMQKTNQIPISVEKAQGTQATNIEPSMTAQAILQPIEEQSQTFLPLRNKVEAARNEVSKQVFGMESMLDQCLIALLSGGHVLCEGLPGLAKTTLAKAFAKVVSCQFKRCQFSPDLLPSDLIGDRIFNQKTNEFDFREGPVFTQILLADEINRSPAKTQAALLEVMQEAQVTVFGERHLIGAVENTDSNQQNNRIFFTIATQNPIEQEGTYRLPEAQLDRFMFRLFFQWPERNAELAILGLENGYQPSPIVPCFTANEVLEWRERIAREVNVPDFVKETIVDLMRATRVHKDILVGAGPRACQVLLRGAKVRAAMRGSGTVGLADVRALAFDALNHRIVLKPDVVFDNPELSPLDVLRNIIDKTLVELQNRP